MVQDDLSIWLKASAENKITQKNAWQATLIDHFVDINANNSVNFQKASCTLEGCMKVYSTRVDDVSDNTMKLLGIFSKEDDPKKKTTKKKSNFIEKNLNHINLKEKSNETFYDPLFSSILSRNDDYALIDFIEPSDLGMVIYTHQSSNLVMNDEKIEIDLEILPICDSLKDFESVQSIERTNQNEFNYDNDIGDLDYNDGDNNYNGDDVFNDMSVNDMAIHEKDESNENLHNEMENKEINLFHETPFGYFKGWAGPSHWKSNLTVERKSIATSAVKTPKQRFFIDFSAPIDYSLLENKADTILTREAILERRRHKNFLPEDYSYETKDLYKFMIKDGYFAQAVTKQTVLVNEVPNDENVFKPTEEFADFADFDDSPADQDISFQIEKSLNLGNNFESAIPMNLKFTRVAKRVDIKKLKENVFSLLSSKNSSLSDIFEKIPQFYGQKEAKEISPHLCLISILHLANEKGFNLSHENGNILINDFKV